MVSAAAEEGVLVDVRGVTFGFGGPPVLLDVSFSIRRGDFLALIGPNGSGKTTLVKVILGLLRPDRGEVTIMGGTGGPVQGQTKDRLRPPKSHEHRPDLPRLRPGGRGHGRPLPQEDLGDDEETGRNGHS